ncbi:hypothetical protein [uncultured Amnibacterium sp.]|uniref:hypothetical protein n=1 Tax=uncultured Amnibacterium sp. TaxID=1631851 RepID=UPI0035CC06F9
MTPDDARLLLLVEDRTDASTSRAMSRAVAKGTHLRLRRGAHAEVALWRRLTKEERLLLRIVALVATSRGRPVFSHWSAAVLHGLPIARRAADLLDLAVGGSRNRTVVGARVHRLALDAVEVTEIAGILCTSAVRTAVDLAADCGFEEAVVVADAALAGLGPDARRMVGDAVDLSDRRRGSARLRAVFAFADARSGSPGESISRVRIHRLGFLRPELQVEIETDGLLEYADFGWEEVQGAGEFDGEVKYRDVRYRKGRTAVDVVIDEKDRENRIRRRRPRFARWVWADLMQGHLETILRETGIPKRRDRDRRPDDRS